MHGEALAAAYGPVDEPVVMSLRELLGATSAYEWQRRGWRCPASVLGCIRASVSSLPFVASTSIWSPERRCPPRTWPSTSVPGCFRPSCSVAASGRSWRPTRTCGRWTARETT